jgi:hypothetical protein
MDKLYWIVCEEKGATLFEGRFQGRTRGAAIKFLKEQIGRPGLNGTVFTITEIPVPLIREIVEAIMKGQPAPTTTAVAAPVKPAESKPERFDPYTKPETEKAELSASLAPLTDWKAVKRFYRDCHSPGKTAVEFGLSVNTVKARIRREGWK